MMRQRYGIEITKKSKEEEIDMERGKERGWDGKERNKEC